LIAAKIIEVLSPMKLKTVSWLPSGFACLLLAVSLFLNGCETPPPADNTKPVDVAHLHVGDTVTVTYSGIPSSDTIAPHEEAIKEDGMITLQGIGSVQAAGLTMGALQNEIYTNYVPRYYTPQLNITVTSTSERVYYVRGEVAHPGEQLYRDGLTVTRAITAAGDFTDFANHAKIVLIRAGGTHIKLNCDKILAGDEIDPPVYPGDQVQVGRRYF
jgi:protein involved in polysaccharide export with SLBB domain